MATYKYTNTSADIGQVPNVEVPKIDVEKLIGEQEQRAASINANPMQLLAGLGRPSTFQTAAASGLAGLQAGMAMPTASPEAAILTGALTGLQAYGGLQQQQRQQQLAELDLIPVDQISPNLVEQFPELSGVPIGMLNKMSGLFSAMGKQKVKPITAGTKAQLKLISEKQGLGLTDEQLNTISEPDAVKYVLEYNKEAGRGERFTEGEANKEKRLRLKSELANAFNLDPEAMPRTMTDDEGRSYLWTPKSGWKLISQRMDKANAGALSDAVAAINGLGNIDTFYDKIDNTMFPQLAQEAGKGGVVGGATSFIFPDVAQARAATTTLFTFANGGKALTEHEMKLIDGLFTNIAYGNPEREKAKANVKSYLTNKIRATIAGNLTGSAKAEVEGMLNNALGIVPTAKPVSKPSGSPKRDAIDTALDDIFGK